MPPLIAILHQKNIHIIPFDETVFKVLNKDLLENDFGYSVILLEYSEPVTFSELERFTSSTFQINFFHKKSFNLEKWIKLKESEESVNKVLKNTPLEELLE